MGWRSQDLRAFIQSRHSYRALETVSFYVEVDRPSGDLSSVLVLDLACPYLSRPWSFFACDNLLIFLIPFCTLRFDPHQ